LKKSICILSLSNIDRDGRVLRQIDYLSQKYLLTVIGYGTPPDRFAKNPGINWRVIKQPGITFLKIIKKIFGRFIQAPFLPKTHPAYRYAVETECVAYLANNWDSLPFAALAARKMDKKLILDLHESYKSWYWGLANNLIKFVFNNYAKDVNASTAVVKPIADEHQQFGLDPIVLRNIPSIPNTLTNINQTNPNKIRLIHHGIASPKRCPEIMIKSLASCDPCYELHLVFVNHESPYTKSLQNLAENVAPGRIFFHPPFPPLEIVQNISKYDIGFFPLPPTNFNYKIALPNKLFEFIAAGLAVCIGPSPSMADIVNQYQCGVVAPSFDPDMLAEILNKTNAEKWDQLKKASLEASKVLNADVEMERLFQIFNDLL